MIVEIVHAAQITIRPVNRNRYRSPLATKSGEEPPLLAGAKRWRDDRELIVQCPRGRQRAKWKNAVVKTQRWRVLGGTQLLDVEDGNRNVSAEHPEVLQRLNRSYDRFWESLPNEQAILSRHIIGEVDTRLNGMDWYKGSRPWNSGSMRGRSSGVWRVDVVKDGRYRFELRRYPREANKAIGAVEAGVVIGDRSASKSISADVDHAILELELKQGEYDLDTKFKGQDGKVWGAYFAYVSLVE